MAAGSTSGVGYRAFISYSHRDQTWARWLHKAIETYRVPSRLVGQNTAVGPIPRRLAPIFRDREELASATDLGRKVNEALAQSANLIVICSPAAAASRWVNEEVLAFKRLGRAERIFCLIVSGEPNATDLAGRASEECFCPALRFAVDDQGRLTDERTEPIAADARPSGDGKANARLKLIAGMLDVGFDALKQREQHRRNRKWAALAAASFAGMLLTGGLSVYALRARHEAIAQRGEAEGLIEYMLGDLRKKLEPVGRLDVMDSVGARALAYYSAQDAGALDADSLGRRARALHLIGEVDDLRGNLDHALDVFEKAARSTSELLARAPNDGQRIFDHAQSVYWVGYVGFQRGQNSVAEKYWNEYKTLAERLIVLDPTNADWQAEVGYAYTNLGTLLIKEGRAAEAAAAFERSLAISSTLAKSAPDDASLQLEAADSHAWLADAREKQGQLDVASNERTTELAIYDAILATDDKNNDARRSALVARNALARLSMANGNPTEAISHLRIATGLADSLMDTEPDNTLWAEIGADLYADYGEDSYRVADLTTSNAANKRSCAITAALIERDASVVRWRAFLLSRCELLQAKLKSRSGDHAGALDLTQRVVDRIDTLHSADKEADQLVRWQLAAALLASGDEYAAANRPSDAQEAWERTVCELAPQQTREDALVQTILAAALLRLGRADEAMPIVARLDGMGYAHPDFIAIKARLATEPRSVLQTREQIATLAAKHADGRQPVPGP